VWRSTRRRSGRTSIFSPPAAWTASSPAARRGRASCSRSRSGGASPSSTSTRPGDTRCPSPCTAARRRRPTRRHSRRTRRRRGPLPFYVYEFEARAGYAVPLALIERLRETAPNLRGLKVSDKPWERLAPYLLDGLDVFVGAEALVARGLEHGAAGAVSGLASVYPEVVSALVRERTAERGAEAERLRGELERFPFHAAAKTIARRRGVPIGPDVRAPLRGLTGDELSALTLW
jgi:dihydrodipicolinate synthase/N-acetylneuraminate lyase